jgi:hypothetical protein
VASVRLAINLPAFFMPELRLRNIAASLARAAIFHLASILTIANVALAASSVILFYILAVNAATSGTAMFACNR